MKTTIFAILIITLTCFYSCSDCKKPVRGNVIFIHPDGAGLGHWNILRVLKVGPDKDLHWDKLEKVSVYRSHQENDLCTSSHAGATAHAYGKKVPFNSFGMNRNKQVKSLSGKYASIMEEAQQNDISVGIINSGHIAEPGTAVFLASSEKRKDTDHITLQLINSNAEIIMGGGENLLLPEGMYGFHNGKGVRKDGLNLIEIAKQNGYKVIYTRNELLGLPHDTKKVLGIFAAKDTYNNGSEEKLQRKKLETYDPKAPTIAEMTEISLKILSHKNRQFFLMVEEEGSDNFSNENNAKGMLDALWRTDDAIGVALDFLKKDKNTLLFTTADSDAGHPSLNPLRHHKDHSKPLPPATENGAPLDGIKGANSHAFTSQPDKNGKSFRFGISWAEKADLPGSVVLRAQGLNSSIIPSNVHNTDVYRILYATLFEKLIPWE